RLGPVVRQARSPARPIVEGCHRPPSIRPRAPRAQRAAGGGGGVTARHKGLGRGLDALLGGGTAAKQEDELVHIPVTALRPGKYQPRTRMDEASLNELADSIRARGV